MKKGLSSAQLVQVNRTDVFVIGGSRDYVTLIEPERNMHPSPKACLKVDITTGSILEMSNVIHRLNYYGLCHTGHFIHLFGGKDRKNMVIKSCEKYNILYDEWQTLPRAQNLPDDYNLGMTFISVKLRFVYGFGGRDVGKMTPDTDVERVMRLDITTGKAW